MASTRKPRSAARSGKPAGAKRAKSGSRRKPASAKDIVAAKQAERHSRIRRDHSSEIAQDYVELIADLIRQHGEARTVDIAERLGVSHVTVAKTVARLQREGLVRSEPYRSIFLTDDGRNLADETAVRHALIVKFLTKLGVNAADAETDAEGMEHHVSEATFETMRRFIEETD